MTKKAMEEQAVNNQVQQAPVNPVPVSKKPNQWILAAIILVVIVVIAGIFILLLNSQKSTSTPPSSISPTSPPVTNVTANWKTYRNEEFGFKLKYPSQWIVDYDDAQRIGSRIVRADGSIKILGLSESEGYSEGIDISAYKEKVSTEFIESEIKQHEIYYVVSLLGKKPLSNCKECSVTEMILKAKPEKLKDLSGGEGPGYSFTKIFYISIPRQDFPHIEIAGFGWESSKNFSSILDQILATFKFTDKEGQVVCTQDAKLCPDGSYVSRQPPTCEFAACPQK